VETLAELDKSGLQPETPKSRAGKRTVAFPAELVLELRWHLERFRGARQAGSGLRRSQGRAAAPVELPEDLEQGPCVGRAPGSAFSRSQTYGGTLSAATGATLKELMARLGHSSVRAAMIYQHATRDRDQAIAQALGALVREVREEPPETPEEQPERREREA